MRKSTKVLISILLAGIAITGIGVGVAFSEYSNLQYGGEKAVLSGPELLAVDEFEFTCDEQTITDSINYFEIKNCAESCDVVYDNTMPADTFRVEVSYNSRIHKPEITTDVVVGNLVLDLRMRDNGSDDFELFMAVKDTVVQDLKEGKIYSYRTDKDNVRVTITASTTLQNRLSAQSVDWHEIEKASEEAERERKNDN